jgi:hypothetical protein
LTAELHRRRRRRCTARCSRPQSLHLGHKR